MTFLLTHRSAINTFSSSIVYRQFWNSINIIRNKYDRKRVQEIGADLACAEWLVRCGGSIRFQNWGSFISKSNQIPTSIPGQFRVEEIRAVNASVTSEGFAYLEGLQHLKTIHLEKCDQVGDSCLARCNRAKDTVESMTLVDLGQISENGLAYLAGMKKLKQINLARLLNIKDRAAVIRLLTDELPQCMINYDDKYPPARELQ
ncbi:unnamed protein product [Adineta ricciae]|uniref:Mitochondrial ATP synthase regulatory component factor B n=1 Tax=Adineta ricciae TaxID=249248 RepID=A0A814JLA1_ADIRI|nr:unnamed protein product [Adineta ricciae]CAF1040805.1 unnamed protein product [Adineta ricciae]